MININYQKRNNSILFQDLEKHLNIEKCQNYIPIYNKMFQLNNTNYNNVNLDNDKYAFRMLHNLDNPYSYNTVAKDISNNISTLNIFIKLSPLLDPVKYAMGKYDIEDKNLLELPCFLNKNSHAKVRDMNNSAYVDGFFSYLSSKLIKKYNFIHGVDYYGMFLGVKNEFIYNATDELELLMDNKFFHEHKNKLFTLDDKYYSLNSDSRSYKTRLEISDANDDVSDFDIIEIDDVNNLLENNNADIKKDANDPNIEFQEIKEFDLLLLENINDFTKDDVAKTVPSSKKSNSSYSDCSSRTSATNTDDGFDDNNNFSDDDDNDANDDDDASYETVDEDDSDDSDATSLTESSVEEIVNLSISKFPVSIICLEKCEYTLDYYMVNNDISDDEWGSILMQIIMILLAYQKAFNFTHNDLHTNNVMYKTTDKKFLYYRYNNNTYKVPTHGKIYKIIDFGRAIYKYNEITYCSDSFHKDGDASTQYNFEPYINNNKPRLEPNYSFDLCRLACSMFDVIVYDDDNNERDDKISLLINEWCKDDKGRNVLYKTNGDERYPDFKLYKMIARTVHNHTPENQLKREMFLKFLVSKHKLSKNNTLEIINIDIM